MYGEQTEYLAKRLVFQHVSVLPFLVSFSRGVLPAILYKRKADVLYSATSSCCPSVSAVRLSEHSSSLF